MVDNFHHATNLSNLDVTLVTLPRFAPNVKVIVFAPASDEAHVQKLTELFPVHATLKFPVSEQAMQAALGYT